MKNQNSNSSIPQIGMGATIQLHSDRHACTIVQVSKGLNIITLQEDNATRLDQNGMSDSQEYSYSTDTQGDIWYATLRKDGRYRLRGSKHGSISLGVRNKFHDYSF